MLRDERVIDTVRMLRAMTTSQIYRTHFKSRRVCQRRLQVLTRDGRLRRIGWSDKGAAGPNGTTGHEYIYTLPRSRHLRNVEHALAVAGAWIDLGMPTAWETELRLGNVTPDAFCRIAGRAYFLEVQLHHGDMRKKFRGYAALRREEAAWRPWASEFPTVLLVTESYAARTIAENQTVPTTVLRPSEVAEWRRSLR